MIRTLKVFIVVVVVFSLCNCGGTGPKEGAKVDSVSGATDTSSAASSEPALEPTPKKIHMCAKPINKPDEVWPRIEAVRALDKDQFKEKCGLKFIEIIGAWKLPPIDLLSPIVKEASIDKVSFKEWVNDKSKSSPNIAAMVVAMDIISALEVGGDPLAAANKAKDWNDLKGITEIDTMLTLVDSMAPLMKNINTVHEIRCTLEVNSLGFAVKCKPIHPQLSKIDLAWETTLEDDLLKDLKLTKCKGRSCKKLKKAVTKLKKKYKALLDKVEAVEQPVFKSYLKYLMVLPPFKDS